MFRAMAFFATIPALVVLANDSVQTWFSEQWSDIGPVAGSQTIARMWSGIEANPLPVLIALATFAITVAFHRFKGASFREAVERAATKAVVVTVPPPVTRPADIDNAVVRASNRVTLRQLVEDLSELKKREKELPKEIEDAQIERMEAEEHNAKAKAAFDTTSKQLAVSIDRLNRLESEQHNLADEVAKTQKEIDRLERLV